MKELKGFYQEAVLEELLYNGEITQLEYIYHHSQEMIDDFKMYCKKRSLQETEASAAAYSDFLLKREEYNHIDGLD